MRSKDELFALMLAHEAAAKALRDEYEHRAREAHEKDGAASTDRLPGGQVTANLSKSHVEITDQELFLLHLKARYPGEVVHRMVRVLEPRNPGWVKKLLEGYQPVTTEKLKPGDACQAHDTEGTVIPGVRWVQGGAFRSISVKAEAGIKEVLGEAAALYASGDAGLDVLQLDGALTLDP